MIKRIYCPRCDEYQAYENKYWLLDDTLFYELTCLNCELSSRDEKICERYLKLKAFI